MKYLIIIILLSGCSSSLKSQQFNTENHSQSLELKGARISRADVENLLKLAKHMGMPELTEIEVFYTIGENDIPAVVALRSKKISHGFKIGNIYTVAAFNRDLVQFELVGDTEKLGITVGQWTSINPKKDSSLFYRFKYGGSVFDVKVKDVEYAVAENIVSAYYNKAIRDAALCAKATIFEPDFGLENLDYIYRAESYQEFNYKPTDIKERRSDTKLDDSGAGFQLKLANQEINWDDVCDFYKITKKKPEYVMQFYGTVTTIPYGRFRQAYKYNLSEIENVWYIAER